MSLHLHCAIKILDADLLPRCDATVEDLSRHKEPRCTKSSVYVIERDDEKRHLCRHHASQEALDLLLKAAGYKSKDRKPSHHKRRVEMA